MNPSRLIFILLLSVYSLHLSAFVDLHATTFTTNDGLENNFVRHIYQDSKGFLWMSTLNGLTRYDGHTFTTFLPERGNNISLLDHHVREVSEDKNHFLWIKISPEFYNCYDLKRQSFVDFTGNGNSGGRFSQRFESSQGDTWLWQAQKGCLQVIYRDGVFSSYEYSQENGKLPSNVVRNIREDNLGNIWICTNQGLAKVSQQQSLIVDNKLDFADVVSHKSYMYGITRDTEIYRIAVDGSSIQFITRLSSGAQVPVITANFIYQGNDWVIITTEGGYVFRMTDHQVIRNTRFNIAAGQVIADDAGHYFVYNNQGLIRYFNSLTGTHKDFNIPVKDRPTDQWCKIIRDSRGLIWIATFGYGLFVYNPETDETKSYTFSVDADNLITSNSLAYIMEDRSGGIWVSSESAGVSHLSVISDQVKFIYPEHVSKTDNSNAIRLIHPMKNGDIMLSNRQGDLYRYNDQLKQIGRARSFPSSVYAMLEETDHVIWYGTRAHGLFRNNQQFVRGYAPEMLPGSKISSIFRDFRNRVWIGAYDLISDSPDGGLVMATSKDGSISFQRFLKNQFREMGVRHISSDHRDWMWVGTDNGLCVFHPDSIILNPDHYYIYNFEQGHFLANRIKFLHFDSNRRMWIGTMGGGLSMCVPDGDYANLTFTHYGKTDGLTNNIVQSIQEDNDGKIWIATEYGISRMTPDLGKFENFFFSSRVLGNVYSESSVLKLVDGRLLFGTNHGLIEIDPRNVKPPVPIAGIAFTGLKINGIAVSPFGDDSPLTSAITYTDKITLKHYQNSFVLEFSTFDYSNSGRTRFTYKLESFDKEWSTASPLNFAAYKKLDPGSYLLRVRAYNPTGELSEHELTLEIIIKPPFWASSTAYFIYFILIVLLMFFGFRLAHNFNTLRNRIQIEKQLTEFKLMFFTNISHEFRTPLTLIKAAMEKIRGVENVSAEYAYPMQVMGRSTDRMLRLVNQLMEFRKLQHNKLRLMLEKTEVIGFLREIFSTLETMASHKQLQCRFDSNVLEYSMFVDRGILDKVVFNLLSNAIKYTPAGGEIALTVEVDEPADQFRFEVSDSGVGIPPEKRGELFSRFMQSTFARDSVGIGLHLSFDLVKLHKGNISYKERPGGGSVFTVTLPLNMNSYAHEEFMPIDKQEDELNSELDSSEVEVKDLQSDDSALKGNKKRILLIEDDIDVNNFLARELGSEFDVVVAMDGISGLQAANEFDGDLIVCDVMMPGMNGFELTRKLRENFETSHIPVILLTAMSSTESQLEGAESGADAYITKPFSPQLLMARIHQLISQRDALRDKFSKEPGKPMPALSTSELDARFASKLNEILIANYSNPDFNLDEFASKLKMGRSIFFKKVKGVTGYTPNEYLRVYRLKKSVELLQQGDHNVAEVAYKVGMSDPLYFSKCFKKQFGVAPSKYLRGTS